jgi:hypothetical protein
VGDRGETTVVVVPHSRGTREINGGQDAIHAMCHMGGIEAPWWGEPDPVTWGLEVAWASPPPGSEERARTAISREGSHRRRTTTFDITGEGWGPSS